MKGRQRAILRTFLIALLALVVAFSGSGLALFVGIGNVRGDCGAHAVNRPDRILFDAGWPPLDFSRYAMPNYETVRFPSRQPGLHIAGWWVPGDSGAPAVILVHGLEGCKNAINIMVPAGMLARNGFGVLMIDVRDVGDSDVEDGWTAAGNQEYLDVLGAWDWLIQEKGYTPERIGLYGGSLGGATALYAFSHEPRVAALFLHSTYASLLAAFANILTSYGLPGFLGYPTAVMGRLVSGDDLLEHRPAEVIQEVGDRPVYIVHSRSDRRISIRQSQELANAALAAGANVTTWFPENGPHLMTPAAYPEEFEQRLVGFFREALAPKVSAPPSATATPAPFAEPETATVAGPTTPTSRPVEMTSQPSGAANKMRWDTNGGGQITFEITPNGANYDVAVSSYQFEDRDERFTITAESGAVYRAISTVMQGRGRIRSHLTNAPRGSWTTLQFGEGADSSTYEDVIVDADLRIIYDYVVAQIEAGQT